MAKRSWFYRLLESPLWKAVTGTMLKLPFPLRFAVVSAVFLVLVVVAVAIPALLLNYGLRLR
jgi:hypothetical protein